jgi:hypothetical protein
VRRSDLVLGKSSSFDNLGDATLDLGHVFALVMNDEFAESVVGEGTYSKGGQDTKTTGERNGLEFSLNGDYVICKAVLDLGSVEDII